MCATDLKEGTIADSGVPEPPEYLSNVSGLNGLEIFTSDEVGSMSDRVDDRDLITRAGVFIWQVLRRLVLIFGRRECGILQPREG